MIEANNTSYPHIGDQLFDLCKANKKLSNIIFLNKLFTSSELQHLSECEHFDVVLVMNILQKCGDYWQETIDAILNMGDNIIIEIPQQESVDAEQNEIRKSIEDYIVMKGGSILDSSPQHISSETVSLYLIQANKKQLQRKTWLFPKMYENSHTIESSFTDKKLIKLAEWPKNKFQTTQWFPGINLLTFKMCNGVYPIKETIKKSILQIVELPHTDWMINNMVLQGKNIVAIDVDDLSRGHGATCKPTKFSEIGLQMLYELIDLDNPQKVEQYFWYRLIRVPVEKRNRVKLIGRLLPSCSLVFDIDTQDAELIKIYLGYGARVLCFNTAVKDTSKLAQKFKHERDVTLVNNNVIRSNLEKITLDNMITLYKCPYLCNIHLENDLVPELLEGLSQPTPYIIFKFDIRSLFNLKRCLNHLTCLGYTLFNFSPRDIPIFALDTNIHTGVKKEWVSAHDLINEIQQFASLDHEGEQLWGYVYACSLESPESLSFSK